MATALSLNKETLDATFGGDIFSAADNTYTIGTSSKRFSQMFAYNFNGSLGDGTIKLYGQYQNEINFGGSNTSSTIYIGYRATDSRSIPDKFIFGGSSGSATLVAATFQGNATSATNATRADKLKYATGGSYYTTLEQVDNALEAYHLTAACFKFSDENENILDFSSRDGMLLNIPWCSTQFGLQIAMDEAGTGTIGFRGKSTNWGNWYKLLHSGNYTNYALPLSGGTISGDLRVNGKITGKYGFENSLTTLDAVNNFHDVSTMRLAYVGNGVVSEFTDGVIISNGVGDSYGHQLYMDDNFNIMWHRALSNGTWLPWVKLLDSGNYTDYTPTKTGSGASGTWGISITGNATTATSLSTSNTSFEAPAAGWYKLAYFNGSDPRGIVSILIYTTGGDWRPHYAELRVSEGWSQIQYNQIGYFPYINSYRLTTDGTYCYLEAYFTQRCNIYLKKSSSNGLWTNENANHWRLYSEPIEGSGTLIASAASRRTDTTFYTSGASEAAGFYKINSDNNYLLLGGGGHLALSTLSAATATKATQDSDGNQINTTYLKLSGGTMTGSLTITETKNILLRSNANYYSGIGYDTKGNECIALWAKNTVTRLRWHAGVDLSGGVSYGSMMDITPDFEISKASGTAIGYIAGHTMLHSGNYTNFTLPLSGGTLTATNTDTPLYLKTKTEDSWIGFQSSNSYLGWLGFSAADTPCFCNAASNKICTLYHTGNLNPVTKRSNGGTTYTDLGYYYASGSTATYVRIAFPSVPTWTMCTMELTIRESYSSKYSGKLTIYANQSSGADWNITAVTHGTLTSNIKVYGSDKKYFYIKGIVSWGGLSVDKMLIGDSAVSSDLTNLTIDGVSALPTTYQTATMYKSFTSADTIPAANLPTGTSSALGLLKVGSNITVSSGTISLTKSNVVSALGYTPPDYTYTSTDPGAGSSLTTGKLCIVYS